MPEFDYRDYTFTIVSKSTNIDICNDIMKSISKLELKKSSYTNLANTITVSMQIPLHQEEYEISELVKKIKNIPNVVDVVNVQKGARRLHRNINEHITLSDHLSVVLTKFENSREIRIEEKIVNNIPQMNFYGDNVTVILNQNNVTSIVGNNKPEVHDIPHNASNDLESLKEEIQKDNLIKKEDKEKTITLIEKIKLYISKPTVYIDKHKEFITFVVSKSIELFGYVIDLLKLFNKGH